MALVGPKTIHQNSKARVRIVPQGPLGKIGITQDEISLIQSQNTQTSAQARKAVANRRRDNQAKSFQLFENIIQLSTNRSISAAGGTFSLVLKSEKADYGELLKPNDWVEIFLDSGIEGERLEMEGLIDRVQTVVSPGSSARLYQITGKEAAGKIVTNAEIWYDFRARPEIPEAEAANKIYGPDGITLDTLTAHFVIPETIREFAGKDNQFVHPEDTTPYFSSGRVNLETYVASTNRSRLDNSIFTFTGKVWSAINRWADRAFHTIYFDVLPSLLQVTDTGDTNLFRTVLKTALVFKEHPYSIENFQALDSHSVDFTEVTTSALGRSDHDVVNVTKVLTPMMHGKGQFDAMEIPPAIHTASFQAHGVRTMYIHTVYPFPGTEDIKTGKFKKGDYVGVLSDLSRRLMKWYIMNDTYVNGTINIGRLRNDIRIGNRLDYTTSDRGREGLSFLIESVQHNYVYSGVSTTTVSVSRGIPILGSDGYKKFQKEFDDRTRQIQNVKQTELQVEQYR